METIYVVQSFKRGKRQALVADKPQQYKSGDEAKRRAERMADDVTGVVAYSMEVDEEAGDYSTPRILASFGDVPDLG